MRRISRRKLLPSYQRNNHYISVLSALKGLTVYLLFKCKYLRREHTKISVLNLPQEPESSVRVKCIGAKDLGKELFRLVTSAKNMQENCLSNFQMMKKKREK